MKKYFIVVDCIREGYFDSPEETDIGIRVRVLHYIIENGQFNADSYNDISVYKLKDFVFMDAHFKSIPESPTYEYNNEEWEEYKQKLAKEMANG